MSVQNLVQIANTGTVYLFEGGRAKLQGAMQELVDLLALRGKVRVILGGNRISFDHLPHILGRQAPRVYEFLDQIWISRAETCYQMQDVLRSLEPEPAPLVIIDLLETFYEEELTLGEVTLLLDSCFKHIHFASQVAPVLISVSEGRQRVELTRMVEQNADARFYFEPSHGIPRELQTRFAWE